MDFSFVAQYQVPNYVSLKTDWSFSVMSRERVSLGPTKARELNNVFKVAVQNTGQSTEFTQEVIIRILHENGEGSDTVAGGI